MGTSKPTDETKLRTDTRPHESRDQLILRRRTAQRAWRSARESMDHAAEHLRATPTGHVTRATIRETLENAKLVERTARASYHRVAEETGTLLGRLARPAD
jgi:hypothetical protein